MTSVVAATAKTNDEKAWKELLAWRILGHHLINRLRGDRGLPPLDTRLMCPLGAIDQVERLLADIGAYHGGTRPDRLEALLYEFTCSQRDGAS